MTCFFNASVKQNNEDSEAGVRGLSHCKNELRAYEACMERGGGKTASKRYRVQDEYRKRDKLAE